MTDEMKRKPKIFLWCEPFNGGRPGDVIGWALAEDGEGLASHWSSSETFAKHDMGLTSNWKHEGYAKHYPDGYELVWLDDPLKDPAWVDAMRLNAEQAEVSNE